MKIGIVLGTNEPETVWNAFRFGLAALNGGHEVAVFLINRGVELEDIKSDAYDIEGQVASFVEGKGQVLACGTCLRSRQKSGSSICAVSSMMGLLKMVEESDRLLTFG